MLEDGRLRIHLRGNPPVSYMKFVWCLYYILCSYIFNYPHGIESLKIAVIQTVIKFTALNRTRSFIHQNPPLFSMLSQMKPVHVIPPYLF